MLIRVLIATDDTTFRKRIRAFLQEDPDVVVQVVAGKRHLWERIGRHNGDLVVVSRGLVPEPIAESLASLKATPDAPEVLVVSHDSDSEDRARLLAAGAYAVLDANLDDDLLTEALSTLISRRAEEATAALPVARHMDEPRLTDFVSTSPAMQTFLEVVRRVVPTDTTLLVLGETGVGKERLARAIHAESPRSTGPFVAVNCGAIPEALLESELFGHQEGAFTGATRARRGWFELAHQGAIFLDEVGEMPLPLQVKLLRVLQTREVYPVGSEKPVDVDVRVMAATNRDLEEAVAARDFRSDLYYRLSVVSLEIPSLRDRRQDIAGLVESYVEHFRAKFRTSVETVSQQAMDALERYDWPGNVRELVNVVERALLLCPESAIRLADLPGSIQTASGRSTKVTGRGSTVSSVLALPNDWLSRPLKELRDSVNSKLEHDYLHALLAETEGKIGEVARRAGLNPRNLFDKMKQLGLRKEDYRGKARKRQ